MNTNLQQAMIDQSTEAWVAAWRARDPHTQLGISPTGKQHCEATSIRWFWDRLHGSTGVINGDGTA